MHFSDGQAAANNGSPPASVPLVDTNDEPSVKRQRMRRWTRCDLVDTPHFWHLDRCTDLGRGQGEGYCLLCSDTFNGNMKKLHAHMARVHTSRAYMYQNKYISMCKYNQVSSRGSDVSGPNAHYHCPICHNLLESPAAI